MKYENSENRFSEFFISWKTLICFHAWTCLINSWIVYKKTDEWYIEWQQVTTSDSEWQQVTTNDNEWQRGAYHYAPKGELFKPLRGPLKKAYWINSRNKHPRRNINSKRKELQKQLFADFHQSKNALVFTGKHLCWSFF